MIVVTDSCDNIGDGCLRQEKSCRNNTGDY